MSETKSSPGRSPASAPQAPSKPASAWRFVAVVFGVGFILRLALLVLLKDIGQGPQGSPTNDDVEFNHLAQSLVDGEGYRNWKGEETSFRAPGFPFFLAGLYALFGVNYPLAYIVFCLLGAANAVLAYYLARELTAETYARAVAVLSALYFGNLTVSLAFISENLFIPLLTLGCWLLVRFLRFGNLTDLAAAGLVLGYATLTRPFSLLLLPLWGLLLGWHLRRDVRRLLVAELFYVSLFLAPILPWTYRNYQVHGHLVLIATNGGSTFFGGNNDVVFDNPRLWGYWVSTKALPERPLIDATPNEYEHDQLEWQLAKDWARAHPGKAALLAVFKFASLWLRPPEFSTPESSFYLLRSLAYYPLLLFMLIGFVRCLGNRALWQPGWAALHLVIAATILSSLIFCGLARFRDANAGLLMIYVVLGWDLLFSLWHAGGASKSRIY